MARVRMLPGRRSAGSRSFKAFPTAGRRLYRWGFCDRPPTVMRANAQFSRFSFDHPLLECACSFATCCLQRGAKTADLVASLLPGYWPCLNRLVVILSMP
eukprot:361603-Chlamydomonas_euryale.AAC.13